MKRIIIIIVLLVLILGIVFIKRNHPNTVNEATHKSVTENEVLEYSDIFVRVKPEKAKEVKSQTIDGQKYLMIPVDEQDQVNLNGIDTNII